MHKRSNTGFLTVIGYCIKYFLVALLGVLLSWWVSSLSGATALAHMIFLLLPFLARIGMVLFSCLMGAAIYEALMAK